MLTLLIDSLNKNNKDNYNDNKRGINIKDF